MSDDLFGHGPAFPVTTASSTHATGIETRDYFAAHALTGILHSKPIESDASLVEIIQWAALVAKLSYAVSDAMIDERYIEEYNEND